MPGIRELGAQFTPSAIYTVSQTVSTLYSHIIIVVYLGITISRLTSIPSHHHVVEPERLLMYLYLMSDIYLLCLIVFFTRSSRSTINLRSHGSAFVRQGAVVFGMGSLLIVALEFFSLVMSGSEVRSRCQNIIHEINAALLFIFVLLQMVVVTRYPRLNIRMEFGLSHLGLKHVIATNAVIWIRTILKESIMEFSEVDEEQDKAVVAVEAAEFHEFEMEHNSSSLLKELGDFVRTLQTEDSCYEALEEQGNMSHLIIKKSAPVLFPFLIEFVLIGWTMFINMWNSVRHPVHPEDSLTEYKPNITNYLANLDVSHSLRGFLLGCVILLLNVVSLIIFFSGLEGSTDEYIGKLINTLVNIAGVWACISAFIKMQRLQDKECDSEMDKSLVYFSGFFLSLYSFLEILVGVFGTQNVLGEVDYPDVQTLNGVTSLVAVLAQILLVNLLLNKGTLTKDGQGDDWAAGREEITFLALLNLSQWLVWTFEVQKAESSRTESEYFGRLSWILVQRITLPLSIFFRFHCTVVFIDAWKNIYRKPEKPGQSQHQIT